MGDSQSGILLDDLVLLIPPEGVLTRFRSVRAVVRHVEVGYRGTEVVRRILTVEVLDSDCTGGRAFTVPPSDVICVLAGGWSRMTPHVRSLLERDTPDFIVAAAQLDWAIVASLSRRLAAPRPSAPLADPPPPPPETVSDSEHSLLAAAAERLSGISERLERLESLTGPAERGRVNIASLEVAMRTLTAAVLRNSDELRRLAAAQGHRR